MPSACQEASTTSAGHTCEADWSTDDKVSTDKAPVILVFKSKGTPWWHSSYSLQTSKEQDVLYHAPCSQTIPTRVAYKGTLLGFLVPKVLGSLIQTHVYDYCMNGEYFLWKLNQTSTSLCALLIVTGHGGEIFLFHKKQGAFADYSATLPFQ